MEIHLSDHFTYKKLLRFSTPSIIMMLVTTIYGMVDGYFVSNYVGKNSFAAVNLIMPLLMAVASFGLLFGTGGSAYIAVMLGQKKFKRANETLTMLTLSMLAVGVILSVVCFLFMKPLAVLLGANDTLVNDCVIYGRILICTMPFCMAQNAFQSLMVTAEKPKLGLIVSIMAGLTNVIGDFLLVSVFHFGLEGAAIATALSWFVGGIFPLIYFSRKNSSLLRFTSAKIDFAALGKICSNGSSEMVSNLSVSLVSILYNYRLIKYLGENGVAAYGVIMYVSFAFIAFSMGYSISVGPIAGYHYGADNNDELKNLLRKSFIIMLVSGVAMLIAAELLAPVMARIFTGYDEELCKLTIYAMRIYSLSFLICGFNIFASAFFTGLNNGKVSAAISFIRTLVFQVISILLFPILFGADGIWLAVDSAEIFTLIITIAFLMKNREKYKYY